MVKLKYGNRKFLTILTFSFLIFAAFDGFNLYAMRFVTDFAIAGDIKGLLGISKIMVFVIISELVLNLMITRFKARYLKLSMSKLKTTYVEKLFAMDILTMTQKTDDMYLSQLSNDMDRYEQKFYLNIIELISIIAQLLASMIILATFHYSLIFISLGLLAFYISMAHKTSKPVEKKEQDKSISLRKYTSYIEESLNGFMEVKQNQLEKIRKKKFNIFASKVQEDNYNLDKKTSQIDALNGTVQMLILLTMIFTGLIVAKSLNLSLGTTLVAGAAFANSTWPMQQISPLISQIRGANAILKDFDQTFDDTVLDGTHQINSIVDLKFSNVTLGYDDRIILEDVNIDIRQGEKVLIIGESGSGKSTLLKSIRRQLEIMSGTLTSETIEIKNYLAKDYFGEISVVDQVGFIFNGSVLDNITLYSDNDIQKVERILAEVGLNEIDVKLELKNNGTNISGGQRARLLLARALFKKKSLIVCDEIFANLDAQNAKEIERDILSVNMTLINVSHIVFEDNINLYDKIFLVENRNVRSINSFEALESRI